MTIPKVLFSFEGRLSRSDYWLKAMPILLPVGIVSNILAYGVDTQGARATAMVMGLFSLWPGFAVLVKRWHDRDRSLWLLLTILIPAVNFLVAIWIIAEVWFMKGTDGTNRFGPDPLRAEAEIDYSTPPPLPVSQPVAAAPAPAEDSQATILALLEACEGTDDLYELLRTRPAAEWEEICERYRLDDLRIEWETANKDLSSYKRFEIITVLAQTLVRYEEILDESPELGLPRSLPAGPLAEGLMARLMVFIASQEGVDVAQGLRIRLYDFAVSLMQADRNKDALICLLASRPSIKEDHDFWICACRHNIAADSRSKDDIAAAITEARALLDSDIPERYKDGARQMLGKLTEWQPAPGEPVPIGA